MNNLSKIALALIKRNKKIHLFIGVIFIVCLTGFITSLSVIETTANVFDNKADELKSAHIYRILSNKNVDLNAIESYLENHPSIESFHIQPSSGPFNKINIPGNEDVLAIFVEIPIDRKHDFLNIINGAPKEEPGINEVWIPSGFANNHKIKVGDLLEVAGVDGKDEYTVSAIVYDPLFVSGLSNPTRIWVRSGQLSLLYGIDQLENLSFSLRLTDIALAKEFLQDFDAKFPTLQFTYNIDYETLKASTNVLTDIIGNGIFAISILLIMISTSLIFFIVSGEIIRDYTIYGVYKGLGFSLRQIKSLNYYKYAILIIVSYPISLIMSFLLTKLILSVYEQSTGVGLLQPKLLFPSIISLILVSLIVFLTILFASRKLNHLKPAKAIRFGYQLKNIAKKTKERISLSPVQMITIKELFIHPLRNSVKVITITGLAVLVFSMSMISDTLSNLFTSELTIGIPESKIFVQTNGNHLSRPIEFILYDLEKEEGIEEVIPIIVSLNSYYLKDGERINLLGYGYTSYENQGLSLIKGQNPSLPNQVAITPTLSKMSGKEIGDKIELNIEGTSSNLTVTGIYQILSNNGNSFRVTKDTFYDSNPEIKDSWIALTLKEGIDAEQMKSQLSAHYGGDLTINIYDEFVENTVGGINSGLSTFSNIIILVVAFICFLALYNLIWIHMIENKKHYGLLKSVGMSNRELLCIQLLKTTIVTAISCVLALCISKFIVPSIIISLLSIMGISEINSSLSIFWILISSGFIFFLTLGSTTWAVRSQKNINLRQLIIE